MRATCCKYFLKKHGGSKMRVLGSFLGLQIRRELAAVFKIKFPFIQMSDFYFIKGERNTIFRPAVKAVRQLYFSHISAKNLCGQGGLVHAT